MAKKVTNKKVQNNASTSIAQVFLKGDIWTKLSFLINGLSNIVRGQIIKGLLLLSMELGFLFYMITIGISSFAGLKTLGTETQKKVFDEAKGIFIYKTGDNSMLILLLGVATMFIMVGFFIIWNGSVKSAYETQVLKEKGKRIPNAIDDFKSYFDKKLHVTLLFLPAAGIIIFTILPLVFMILIAFTNFDRTHQPPGNLFTWVGFANFKVMLSSGNVLGKTFWPILGWTIIWAIFSTFLNYIFGMLLAMLINRKGTRLKGLWRIVFVLSIAVPQFVSLLVMRSMLQPGGAINVLLRTIGVIGDTASLPFLTNGLWAKVTVIVINLWVGVPYTMLITTGILQNIPSDLYESAKVDGANSFVTFVKITLPYMLFVTTPYLITQFISNINNFNVIFLLTQGAPNTLSYYQAGKTDLLVTWLYKLTTASFDYSYAAVIGILVFILCGSISLITYRNTGSYKDEEGFQ